MEKQVNNVNPDSIRKRLTTGLIGAFFVSLLIIYGGMRGVSFLAFISASGCLLEYFLMLFPEREFRSERWMGIILGVLVIFLLVWRLIQFNLECWTLVLLLFFLFYLFRAEKYHGEMQKLLSHFGVSLLGIVYIGYLFSYWPLIRELPHGYQWIFLLFIIAWSGDTGGYFIGRRFGRQKLYPAVSPHKTVEGVMGGIALSLIGVFLGKLIFFSELTVLDCLVLGIGGSIFGQLGDLFESLIKRGLGAKDSGYVIPGHGGILDRFDAVMFVAPFLYLYAVIR